MDFFEAQERSQRRTRWLIALYFVAMLAVALAVTAIFAAIMLWAETSPIEAAPQLLAMRAPVLANIGIFTLVLVGIASLYRILTLREGGDTRRIEAAHQDQSLFDLFQRVGLVPIHAVTHVTDLFDRGDQETIGVQVADDRLGDLALACRQVGHVQLPEQVVVEIGLARQGVLDRSRLPHLVH